MCERLDASAERAKEANDFLAGAAALVQAMRSGQIQCRVYARRKFHAKAYITHARSPVVGSTALVGSSNFTVPGLTENVELNKIYNHTDLMRGPSADGRDFPAEFQQIKEQADVVVIDEAHHFRNRGLATADDGTIRSRYWQLYDLHWNPVRLMQRIGRVDRRLDPAVEAQLVADHPDQAALRGKVVYWNFLPPEELDDLLRLYHRVSNKTLRISKVFGIEGRKLLKPEDIVACIRCAPETPRHTVLPAAELREVRLKIERHIQNTYLKQVQAPVGVKPVLKCWMELN